MGKGRVELPRLAAHDPKSCLSASSSTSPRAAERERVNQLFTPDLLTAFLRSRRDGTSEHTLKFYHTCLKRFLGQVLTSQSINEFLHNLSCRNAKHSYYRAIRALCGWLCKEGHLEDNPMSHSIRNESRRHPVDRELTGFSLPADILPQACFVLGMEIIVRGIWCRIQRGQLLSGLPQCGIIW